MSTRAKKNQNSEKSVFVTKKIRNRASGKLETGSYRIIGGTWRSRRLNFPAIDGLRPTTDRVRETIFNWLSFEIQGATVLDIFSGSGALGFEALSRGAKGLLAIEKDKNAAKALKENISLLLTNAGSDMRAEVKHADALSLLAASNVKDEGDSGSQLSEKNERFDLIFLDPPFRKGLLQETINLLEGHPFIANDALIYLEFEKEMTGLELPLSWKRLKSKSAGQVNYQLFRVKA